MSDDEPGVSVTCHREVSGWRCEVRVAEGSSQTNHSVTVSDDELARYAPGVAPDVHQLVEQSFRFLLEREPKESILSRFALGDIERYFPDYREWMNR